MCECCKNIRWGKVMLAGILFTIIATIIHTIESFLTMSYYLDPQYFGVWSKAMMPNASPPPTSFFITSILFSFLTGVTLAIFYDLIKEKLAKTESGKVICFTGMLVTLGTVFFTLPVYLLINIPGGLMISWFLSSVIIFLLTSMIFVKVLK